MSKVASKEKRIADIVLMLEQGKERKEILQKLSKTCKLSARTLDEEIKSAKIILSKRNEEKEAIRQATMSKDYAEALNEQIISDIEIEAVLCKIITNGVNVIEFIKGAPTLRDVTPSEIIQAAKTLYVKRGSNAPTKVADVNPDGSAKEPQKVVMTESQLLELKKSIESKK